jgi:hypothetical protein
MFSKMLSSFLECYENALNMAAAHHCCSPLLTLLCFRCAIITTNTIITTTANVTTNATDLQLHPHSITSLPHDSSLTKTIIPWPCLSRSICLYKLPLWMSIVTHIVDAKSVFLHASSY